jgi:predicted permease
MNTIGEWIRRVWYLLNRRRFDAALQEEMAAHRDALADPRRFGNSLRLREEAADAWGWRWLDDVGRDVRFGARALRRSPVFAATSVLVLSLGIGVNLALFQVVNAALIQPPHLKDPATLVRFHRRGPHFTSTGVAFPIATFVEQNSRVLSAVLTRYAATVAWNDRGEQRVPVAFVSTNWFDELGASAAMGRLLGPADVTASDTPSVVVSYRFWRQSLNGRSDVVGSTLRINDRPAVVVGVASPEFPDVQIEDLSMWMSLPQIGAFLPGSHVGTDWSADSDMFARLRPGTSRDAAKAALQVTMAELARLAPEHVASGEWLEPYLGTEHFLRPATARQRRNAVLVLMLLAALVLIIACLNLSNLTLSRALSRVRELSIRVGLGASRWRIVRHLLAECAVVAAMGAVGGLVLGQVAVQMLLRVAPPFARLDFAPDWRVGLAMFGSALLAMIVVGLSPAWTLGRSDLARATRDGGERLSSGLQSARLRYWLVAGQIACSCLLLVFTAQLVHSVRRALAPDLGFAYADVVVLDPSLGSYGMTRDGALGYWRAVREAVDAHPEMAAAALVSYAPLNGQNNTSRYNSTPQLRVTNLHVEPAFFSVMQIPIVAGRIFDAKDDARMEVVISRRVALAMYGTLDVIGRKYPKGEPQWEIVGLAGDAHLINLQATDAGEQYFPIGDKVTGASLIVRAQSDPARLLSPLRQASRAAAPSVAPEIRLMRDDFERALEPSRLASAIAGAIALLALVLACLGIFGVVAHGARLRIKEVGIRLALGARASEIVRILLRQLAWAGAVGLALGAGGALLLTRTLAGEPFYLEFRDPAAYAAAVALLAFSGACAAIAPALRTLRADPLRALRQD